MDRIFLLAFGIAFVLGLCLAGFGAWLLRRKIQKARDEEKTVQR